MIKLKDLIYEAWKTPLGTPDEVTEILYRIVEKVESKGLNPKDYIGIIQKKFRGWRETCWVIQDLKKPDRFLAFSPFTKDWYYSLIGFKNKFPASDAVVNAVIRQWAEILKEETDNPHLTMGNFKSDYEMVCRKIKNELSKTDKLMPIKRVSDRDLFELYGKYTKYKRVDEDLLNKVVDQLKENTIRIIVYNKLIFGNWYYKSKIIKTDTPMGDETENDYKLAYNLTGGKMDKLDSIEDQITYATKNDENLYSFIWIEAILKPLKKLYTSRNEQELLFYMDRLLQIYHHNGNLADMIILGGVNTLNKINTMSYKGIVLPGNVSEGIENDLHVISTPQNVSIMYRHPSSHKSSIASIDNIGDFWWISRVLVSDKNMRRQGIGSILLRRAVQEVLKHDPKARIVVEPSGYDLKTEDQVRFYTKNGFIPLEGHPGGFIYNNQND